MATTEPPRGPGAPGQQQQQQQQQTTNNPAQPFTQYPGAYGQGFVPYHQYQAPVGVPAAGVSATPQRFVPEVIESKGWVVTRSALHGAGMVICVLCLALSFSFSGDGVWRWMAWLSTPLPFIGFLWSLAELLTRRARNFKSGIHPGAHVGVCLILWLGASIVGGMHTTFAVIYRDYDDDSSYYCGSRYNSDSYGYDDYYDCDGLRGRYAQYVALVVFTWLNWLVYFVLFIGACVDTHKRNRAARQQPVMMIHPGSYWGPAAQGFQQLPPGGVLPPQGANFAPVGAQQSIPLHNRAMNPAAQQVNPVEFYNDKSQGPQSGDAVQGQRPNSHQVTEYFSPSAPRA